MCFDSVITIFDNRTFMKFSKHLLTEAALYPSDKQDFDLVEKICNPKVIDLVRTYVTEGNATALYLQLIYDVIAVFKDKFLLPLQRLEKMWYVTFIVRIWRYFIVNHPDLTLKNNFMSVYCYYCIELNAHSLIYIMIFLKKNNLTHLFLPSMISSQPVKSFIDASVQ